MRIRLPLFAFLICLTLSMSISPVFAVVPITAQNDGSLSDLFELQNSTGSNLAWVDSSGSIYSVKGLNSTGYISLNHFTTAVPHQQASNDFGIYSENAQTNVNLMSIGSGFPNVIKFYEAFGTASTPSVISANTQIGNINYFGFTGSGSNGGYTGFPNASVARLSALSSETYSPTTSGSYFQFVTTNTGTTTQHSVFEIFGNSSIWLLNPAFTQYYHIKSKAITSDENLDLPLIKQEETLGIVPHNNSTSNSTVQTNSITSVYEMVDSPIVIRPSFSGNVTVFYSTSVSNSVANDGCEVKLQWGTGAPPRSGAALTGTTIGVPVEADLPAANERMPISIAYDATGLGNTATRTWIEPAVLTLTGGVCSWQARMLTTLEH